MNQLRKDLVFSLRVVWLIASFVILMILAAPFALGSERAARLAPVCQSKARYGRECAFCGMTTGFLAISEGRIGDAERSNQGSVPLYALFVVNELCVIAFVTGKGGLACKYSV